MKQTERGLLQRLQGVGPVPASAGPWAWWALLGWPTALTAGWPACHMPACLQIDYRDSKPRDFFESSSCKLWLHRLLAGGASSRTQLTAGPPAAEAQAAAALSKALAEAAPWRGCGGGGFTDAFRAFHPGRANAYTCWSTATNARWAQG